MKIPQEQPPKQSVTLSLLTSEVVYKLITAIERLIRWLNKTVIRPGRLLYWCLRWG